MTKRICLLLAVACLVGCGPSEPTKRYTVQGVVRAVDAQSQTVTIAAGKVAGWMEAMTMEYPVKSDTEFAKLQVGERLEATIVVKGEKYYLTDIKVMAKP